MLIVGLLSAELCVLFESLHLDGAHVEKSLLVVGWKVSALNWVSEDFREGEVWKHPRAVGLFLLTAPKKLTIGSVR